VRRDSPRPHQLQEPDRVVGVVVVAGEQLQRLERAHARVDPALLQHHPDARAELDALGDGVEAEHAHPALAWRAVALERLHGGGLAGSVGAEQAEHLAPEDLEGQTVDGGGRAVALDEPVHLDGGKAGLAHVQGD